MKNISNWSYDTDTVKVSASWININMQDVQNNCELCKYFYKAIPSLKKHIQICSRILMRSQCIYFLRKQYLKDHIATDKLDEGYWI